MNKLMLLPVAGAMLALVVAVGWAFLPQLQLIAAQLQRVLVH